MRERCGAAGAVERGLRTVRDRYRLAAIVRRRLWQLFEEDTRDHR